jgi:hypothetical protein
VHDRGTGRGLRHLGGQASAPTAQRPCVAAETSMGRPPHSVWHRVAGHNPPNRPRLIQHEQRVQISYYGAAWADHPDTSITAPNNWAVNV